MATSATKKAEVSTTSSSSNLEVELANHLSTKAVSAGTRNIAAEFEAIARQNNQDRHQRARGGDLEDRLRSSFLLPAAVGESRNCQKQGRWNNLKISKLPNEHYAYPEAVKQEIARIQEALKK